MSARAVITGVAEAGIGYTNDHNALQLGALAAVKALADAGVSPRDVDAVCSSKGGDLGPADRPALEVAEYLGIRPRYIDTTLAGGCSPVLQIMHAADAIAAGRCSTALVVYGSTQASRRERSIAGHSRPADQTRQAEQAAGIPMPIGVAALATARHMAEFGTTREQVAMVAVSQRQWAALNPEALKRDPLTVDDVLASALVSDPLHRDDICLRTDGAGAVVVQRDNNDGRGVRISGYGEAHGQFSLLGAPDLTSTLAGRSSQEAFKMSSLAVTDIDLVQLYDAFTILPLVLLEDLGFCAKGEGGSFIESGATRPGGSLPMNTMGGGLSHCHPGIYGIFLVIEAVRQLRGHAGQRQVKAENALVQAAGGGAFGGSQATLILERQR